MANLLILSFAKQYSLKLKLLIPNYRRMILPVLLCVLLLQGQTREITLRVLSDAFWQVSVFVALTLTIYHLFADKISHLYTNSKGEKEPLEKSLLQVLWGFYRAVVAQLLLLLNLLVAK